MSSVAGTKHYMNDGGVESVDFVISMDYTVATLTETTARILIAARYYNLQGAGNRKNITCNLPDGCSITDSNGTYRTCTIDYSSNSTIVWCDFTRETNIATDLVFRLAISSSPAQLGENPVCILTVPAWVPPEITFYAPDCTGFTYDQVNLAGSGLTMVWSKDTQHTGKYKIDISLAITTSCKYSDDYSTELPIYSVTYRFFYWKKIDGKPASPTYKDIALTERTDYYKDGINLTETIDNLDVEPYVFTMQQIILSQKSSYSNTLDKETGRPADLFGEYTLGAPSRPTVNLNDKEYFKYLAGSLYLPYPYGAKNCTYYIKRKRTSPNADLIFSDTTLLGKPSTKNTYYITTTADKLDETGGYLAQNSYEFWISKIEFVYDFIGETISDETTNNSVTHRVVTWPRPSVDANILYAGSSFTVSKPSGSDYTTLSFELTQNFYNYYTQLTDKVTLKLFRQNIAEPTKTKIYDSQKTALTSRFTHTLNDPVSNLVGEPTTYTAEITFFATGGSTDGVSTTFYGKVQKTYDPLPIENLNLKVGNENGKWYLEIKNKSSQVHYTPCDLEIQVESYTYYEPTFDEASRVFLSKKIKNPVPDTTKFKVAQDADTQRIQLVNNNKQVLPPCINSVTFKITYMFPIPLTVYPPTQTVKPYAPTDTSQVIKVTKSKAVIDKDNPPWRDNSVAFIEAGTIYMLRSQVELSLTIPLVLNELTNNLQDKVFSSISNTLHVYLRKNEPKTYDNSFSDLFSFNGSTETQFYFQLNQFSNSTYLNGFRVGSATYDINTSKFTLFGTVSHIFIDPSNNSGGSITARYDAPAIWKTTKLGLFNGDTNLTDIELKNINFNPNTTLSKPWKKLSNSIKIDYKRFDPSIVVNWINPEYPNSNADGSGNVNEQSNKIKREHKDGDTWVIDKKFSDDGNSDWKTITKGSVSFDDFLFGNDVLTNTNMNDGAFDNANATIYRTYRYTICGYNEFADGIEANKYSTASVTDEITPSQKIIPVGIKSVTAIPDEKNDVINVSWTSESYNIANGTYPAYSYQVYASVETDKSTYKAIATDVKTTFFIHRARPGIKYNYMVYPISSATGTSGKSDGYVGLPENSNDKSILLPFSFSKGANTSILSVANRTFYLSDMDRAIVMCNNKIYKAGLLKPKFSFTAIATSGVGDGTSGIKVLQTGKYEAYVVLVRKDTGTRSNPSDPVKFNIGVNQNVITFTVELNAETNRIPLRDKAYTSYGKEIASADYWEVYIKCLDNDSFGEPVCVASSNVSSGTAIISNLTDENILSVTNRRLPTTLPYSIAPCCSIGEFYNNRLYLTGELSYLSCESFVISNGDHLAVCDGIIPEAVVGKQIYINGNATGWTVTDIEQATSTTTLYIEHFDITTNTNGWDLPNVDTTDGDKVTFQTTSSKVYYSAYFFGEPDGVTYTFSPETFPPLNVLESELSSNDFSSPIALVKSRDSLFVGKRDKMIAITGGNTDDNTYILNTTINILSNTLGVLGRRTIARDDQDNIYCLSDHGLVVINSSGVNLVNYIGNTKSSFRLLFDLSDVKDACAVWSPRDQYYIVFGLQFKGESSRTAGLIYDNYVQQVRPFSLPVEVTSAMVCPAENGEYQIVIADSSGCIGTFLDRTLSHDVVFDLVNSTYKKTQIKGNITTGVYKPAYGLTLGPYLYPGFRPSLPEIDEANSSSFVRPQSVTVGFDLLGRTNYFNQFNPEVDSSVNFTIPMSSTSRRVAVKQMTGQALSLRVDFEVMDNHIDFGSAMVDVNEETY